MAGLENEDPIAVFQRWLTEAEASEINDPTAMCLATVDAQGLPEARMVLLKGVDDRGFVFYTNVESRKADALRANREAALCFHWKSLRRQVRVVGPVEPTTTDEADAYFASRARISQLGAWASLQSRPLDSRATLEARLSDVERRFDNAEVPRPDNWSGYRVVPRAIEFWQDQPYRLHDRHLFERGATGWRCSRLYP
jgi:pyridoxamine 5'-phosphate oxidase